MSNNATTDTRNLFRITLDTLRNSVLAVEDLTHVARDITGLARQSTELGTALIQAELKEVKAP